MSENLVASLRKKLPIQNPLHSFVHNNILQMFETDEFHIAVGKASKLYRATPYWPVHRYIEKFEEGKISKENIFRSIDLYCSKFSAISSLEKIGLTNREYFYRLMFSELNFNDDELQSAIKSTELWNLCLSKMEGRSLTLSRRDVRWRGRGYWEKYYKESYSLSVHPLIIRLISSYLDQGMSFWRNPFSAKSLWDFFVFDIQETKSFADGWKVKLTQKVNAYQSLTSQSIIDRILKEKGIPESVQEDYLLEILFDLKGWAGMVNKLELEPWQATVKAPPVKLVDYIAMVLVIEDAIDEYHSERESIDLSNIHGREEITELKSYQLSIALYQITESFKLDISLIRKLSSESLISLVDEVDTSEFKDRVRLWHEAFENQYHQEAIKAIASHSKAKSSNAYAQVLFCIDDREESMRRHLEEVDSGIESFGVVGFFGIDMNFSSLKSQRLIAQCPPVISPSRIVKEVPKNPSEKFHKLNNLKGSSDLYLYYYSRTLFRGSLSTLVLGLLSLIPMFLQVFFPELAKMLQKKINELLLNDPVTDIKIEKEDVDGHGYSVPEMAGIVEGIFKMCGIRDNFSEMVVLMAHGSSSNNNPFKQAYGCGACGGNAGIPNSRAFAKMANNPEVRKELHQRGMIIPDNTFVISGYHDTCTDEFHFFNVDLIPSHLTQKFENIKKSLLSAAKLNALERCQKFSSFSSNTDQQSALEHVRERAHDLAQPRPEYGHSSNALAIVAKRDFTKGLFLNRRSFLLTYDWEQDPDGEVLKQVVIGGVPVCVNINMDYYFSSVDNDNFGCGSKLPLNLTSLLGVMTGSQSDLRIGLARQMIEIHEPIRNLTIIEAPIERVNKLFQSHLRLRNILYNHWMRLAVKDPVTNKWWSFENNLFEELEIAPVSLPEFKSSLDIITNGADVDFAEIKSC